MTRITRLIAALGIVTALLATAAPAGAHTVERRCYNGRYQERYADIKPIQPYWAGNHTHDWSPWYTIAYTC